MKPPTMADILEMGFEPAWANILYDIFRSASIGLKMDADVNLVDMHRPPSGPLFVAGREPVNAEGRALLELCASRTDAQLRNTYSMAPTRAGPLSQALFAYRDSLPDSAWAGWVKVHEDGIWAKAGVSIDARVRSILVTFPLDGGFTGSRRWPEQSDLPAALAAANAVLAARAAT